MIAHCTPFPLAREIVRALRLRPGITIVEGHVGDGSFVKALAQVYPNHGFHVEVGDLNPESEGLRLGPEVTSRFASWRAYPGLDFLNVNPWRLPDLILGNPPYGDETTRDEAEPHIRRALEIVRPGGSVCYLLQNGFLFGTGRYDRVWRPGSGIARPFHVWHIVGRPSFRITGADEPEENGTSGSTNRYEYDAIWWNTAVPDPKTTIDWLADPAYEAARLAAAGTKKRIPRAWSGA